MRRSQLKRPAAAGANASKRPPSTIGFTSASALPRVPEEASAPTAEAIAAPAAALSDFSQSSSFTLTAVGLQHYRRANLEDGTAVKLVREPDNTHDAQAIAVKVHHKTLHGKYTQLPLGEDRTYPGRSEAAEAETHNKVGMLAFPQAHELAPLLDAGACTVANSRIVGRRTTSGDQAPVKGVAVAEAASFTLFGGPSGPGLGLGAFGDDSKRSDC